MQWPAPFPTDRRVIICCSRRGRRAAAMIRRHGARPHPALASRQRGGMMRRHGTMRNRRDEPKRRRRRDGEGIALSKLAFFVSSMRDDEHHTPLIDRHVMPARLTHRCNSVMRCPRQVIVNGESGIYVSVAYRRIAISTASIADARRISKACPNDFDKSPVAGNAAEQCGAAWSE